MGIFKTNRMRSVILHALLVLLLGFVGGGTVSALTLRNPIVRLGNTSYSDNGTEVTLNLWMYNYDGDNAYFVGDVYLFIDGKQACKLNDMWGLIANVSNKNEDNIKNYQNSGNVGSAGKIVLDGINQGTAQFRNAKKRQKCPYNSNRSEAKWTTIDLKLSFNDSFSFFGHKITIEGKWRDKCDDKNRADKVWTLDNALNGFVRPVRMATTIQGGNVLLSWQTERYNASASTDGNWVVSKRKDGKREVVQKQSGGVNSAAIVCKNFDCLATYDVTFLPSTCSDAVRNHGLTSSRSASGHQCVEGICDLCNHTFFEYQTENGNLVTLDATTGFGAKMLSHRVVDGKCVMEFDAPITQIPRNAFLRKQLKGELRIPKSVTVIGENAFGRNEKLEGDLVIPNSVKVIEPLAFRLCKGFNGRLTLSANLQKIGDYAFSDCSGLTGNLSIPNSVTTLGANAFERCGGFNGKLVLSNGLTKIQMNTFTGCVGLTGDLSIPHSVTEIGNSAFADCSGFNGKLVLPEGLKKIGTTCFDGCGGLTGDLVIPQSVTEIAYYSFRNCSGFTGKLVLPNGLTKIETGVFDGCKGLTGDLVIPQSVTEIADNSFQNCSGFTGKLVLPNGLTKIGRNAFYYCEGLTGDLLIPQSVTEIGEYAFSLCQGFTGKLVLPNGLKKIATHAFSACTGLTGDLSIPHSVTEMGDYAFSSCKGFKGKLVLSNGLTKIATSAFSNCPGFTGDLLIPHSVTEIGKYAFCYCSGFTGKLSLPEGLKIIRENAFNNLNGLSDKQVVLPTTLEDLAFGCFNSIEKLTYQSWIGCTIKCCKEQICLSDASYIYEGGMAEGLDISYTRTFSNTWGTLVLPFAMTLTGDEPYSLYVIESMNADELVLRRMEGQTEAGTPYLVKRNGEQKELSFEAQNAYVTFDTQASPVEGSTLSFSGTYKAKDVTSGYIIRNDRFWDVSKIKETSGGTQAVKVGPFRSWLDGDEANGASVLSLHIGDYATGIDNLAPLEMLNADDVVYYDLNGKRLSTPQRGINIVKRGNKTMKVIIK